MPTYDYVCKTCGHRFEYFQSITADALTHCPVSLCIQEDEEMKGKGDVKRIVSGGAGLVFKGEGFYLTDYVRKGGGEKSSGEKSSGSETSGSKSSGTDTSASGGTKSGGTSSTGSKGGGES